jgi:hypothetical protein
MNASAKEQKERIWELIEAEKGRDRTLKRVSTGAWVVTFVALLFTAVGIGFNVAWAVQMWIQGDVYASVIFREAMPFVWVLGAISLLVAVLSTVGIFLRFRAASLAEIRLRLAAVEQMLTDQPVGNDETR